MLHRELPEGGEVHPEGPVAGVVAGDRHDREAGESGREKREEEGRRRRRAQARRAAAPALDDGGGVRATTECGATRGGGKPGLKRSTMSRFEDRPKKRPRRMLQEASVQLGPYL